MSKTLVSLLVHVVFSTENRQAMITPEIEPELYAYMGGTANIAVQKERHQKLSFEQELLLLLKKYRVDFDEHYLWT